MPSFLGQRLFAMDLELVLLGLLLTRLRGSSWPPQEKSPEEQRHARRCAHWRQEVEQACPAKQPPAREKMMARYGIDAPTMAVWEKAIAALALQMTRATCDTWLRGSLLLSVENGSATLGVRHRYGAEWVEKRLVRVILATLSRELGEEVEGLRVVALEEAEGDPP